MHSVNLFFIIEIAGTIAFAWSGAMVAIHKNLDLLGIIVLGVITAVGGGMIRDIIIGIHPPTLFVKPVYVTAAFISIIILFLAVRFLRGSLKTFDAPILDWIFNILDAIGLGIFTVTGIDTGINAGLQDYTFLLVFLGVITGVGGGLLRDIMAGITPAILRKHIYACASLAGAISYLALLQLIPREPSLLISSTLVVIIRILAKKYEWNLPKAL
jgi:uncharacterized membrane protein YeiH